MSGRLEQYAASLAASGAVRSDRVRQALLRVERHRFLDHWYRLEPEPGGVRWVRVEFCADRATAEDLDRIYSDEPLVTRVDGLFPTSSMSQPHVVAAMLEALDVAPGMRVLEIGTGTGYSAALLAEVLGDPSGVYSVEVRNDVAREAVRHLSALGYGRAHVACSDGFHGLSDGAPYDRIIATVGCPDIAPAWVEQLAPDGFAAVPLQHGHDHPLVRWHHSPPERGSAVGRVIGFSGFMAIAGTLASPNPWQSYLIGGLPSSPVWEHSMPGALRAGWTAGTRVFDHPVHRDFCFFLSLVARELWRTADGYGLADPAAGAVLTITGRGVEGKSRGRDRAPILRLWRRFGALLRQWEKLGRPAAGDYELVFLPKQDPVKLGKGSNRVWVIERARHWELVRLP